MSCTSVAAPAELLALDRADVDRAIASCRASLTADEVVSMESTLHAWVDAVRVESEEPTTLPKLVGDRIYVAPHVTARDMITLRRLPITGILSVCAEVGPQFVDEFECVATSMLTIPLLALVQNAVCLLTSAPSVPVVSAGITGSR